jgi:hypothetical protein
MQNFLDRTMPILGHEGLNALSTPLIAIAGLGVIDITKDESTDDGIHENR